MCQNLQITMVTCRNRGEHHTPTHAGTVFTGMGMGMKKYTWGLPVSFPSKGTIDISVKSVSKGNLHVEALKSYLI